MTSSNCSTSKWLTDRGPVAIYLTDGPFRRHKSRALLDNLIPKEEPALLELPHSALGDSCWVSERYYQHREKTTNALRVRVEVLLFRL